MAKNGNDCAVELSSAVHVSASLVLRRLGAVGVPWTYIFGFMRLFAVSRLIHSVGCAENNLLLRRRQIDPQQLLAMRMAKLIVAILVVIHVNACLWCIVARIQLGPGVMEPRPTSFFPKRELLTRSYCALNAYLHAVQ
jgi:hypothetical protein